MTGGCVVWLADLRLSPFTARCPSSFHWVWPGTASSLFSRGPKDTSWLFSRPLWQEIRLSCWWKRLFSSLPLLQTMLLPLWRRGWKTILSVAKTREGSRPIINILTALNPNKLWLTQIALLKILWFGLCWILEKTQELWVEHLYLLMSYWTAAMCATDVLHALNCSWRCLFWL